MIINGKSIQLPHETTLIYSKVGLPVVLLIISHMGVCSSKPNFIRWESWEYVIFQKRSLWKNTCRGIASYVFRTNYFQHSWTRRSPGDPLLTYGTGTSPSKYPSGCGTAGGTWDVETQGSVEKINAKTTTMVGIPVFLYIPCQKEKFAGYETF